MLRRILIAVFFISVGCSQTAPTSGAGTDAQDLIPCVDLADWTTLEAANHFASGEPCGRARGLETLETLYPGLADLDCRDGTFVYWNDVGYGRTGGGWTVDLDGSAVFDTAGYLSCKAATAPTSTAPPVTTTTIGELSEIVFDEAALDEAHQVIERLAESGSVDAAAALTPAAVLSLADRACSLLERTGDVSLAFVGFDGVPESAYMTLEDYALSLAWSASVYCPEFEFQEPERDESRPNEYGQSVGLDYRWDACAEGELEACDDLFWAAPPASDYLAFGNTCGERSVESFGDCGPEEYWHTGSGYGDSPRLDAQWDGCTAGDLSACDILFSLSLTLPTSLTDYAGFGNTCGNRLSEGLWDEFGGCQSELG
jgi:hypothetical protein